MILPLPNRMQQYSGDLQDQNPSKNFNNPNATDLPAASMNKCRASLMGMLETSFQAYLKYDTNAGKILQYIPSWDVNRSKAPIITSVGSYYVVQFPNTVIDIMGNVQVVQFSAVACNADVNPFLAYPGRGYNFTGQITTTNQVTIYQTAISGFLGSVVFDCFIF